MKAKVSKRLVIDASVARSSGGKNAISSTSKNCRDFLLAVLEICHQVAMTREIRAEWDKHQSIFSQKWLRSMIAKKKIIPCPNISVNSEIWDAIESLTDSDKQRAAMIKDLHLIEAALATDKIVVSLDENTARKLFTQAANHIEALTPIGWVNPDKVEENALDWLEKGAELEEERTLGFCSKKDDVSQAE